MIIDSLVCAPWILPVQPLGTVHENSAIAIHHGRILGIHPRHEALELYQPLQLHDLEQHVLLPGFINAHTHAPMSLLRGFADDRPLMAWLHEHIWPAERRWLSPDWIRDGVRLAMAEMLRSGTTCFNDMYFFPEVVMHEALETGLRCSGGMIVMDYPSAWAEDVDTYLRQGLEMRERFRHHALASFVFAPHAPYTVSDGTLERIRTLADELDCGIHMHVHETAHEITQSIEQHGVRPLARLDRLGLLTPRLMAVHMTQLLASEIDLLADRGVSVIHCPESNMKLASGFCPVTPLHQAGVTLALGTDGAASNNDLDMLGEMRSAAFMAKAVSMDPSSMPAHQALHCATLGGATALGIDAVTGSLNPGKWADMIAVNLETLETQPCFDVASTLVYAADRRQVTHAWVAGRLLMRERELTSMDLEDIQQRTRHWQQQMQVKNRQDAA
ncbi:MAG: hypothetical protein RIQ52_1390 [Pseudomonadota bacterium]